METFKSISISIIILIVLGGIGYWAVSTMQSGSEFETNQIIKKLQDENKQLKESLKDITKELDSFKSKKEEVQVETREPEVIPQVETKPVTTKAPTTTTTTTTYKYQSLISELQKVVDANVFMKLGSTGTRVGSLQKFLNIYNKTSTKIDNDFGLTTQKAIMAFQKAQGLKADGEVGPTTIKKMIEWLKKQK